MTTPSGPITAVPLSDELDDRTLLIDRRHSEADWAARILAARDYLAVGAPRFGGRVLGFPLPPYAAGRPLRIFAPRQAPEADGAVWTAAAGEIAAATT